jgi:signal transduction histidine kinase
MRGMSLRHRIFALFLLGRFPLPTEAADIDAALAWARRTWPWLALAYAAALWLMVWPAFAGNHPAPYRAIALVATHFLLYAIAATTAGCWVGFRVGYFAASIGPAIQATAGVGVLLLVWYFLRADPNWQGAFRDWARDTFTSVGWLLGGYLVLAFVVPDLVARLRRRERASITRALKAEAASERLARQSAESELRLLQAQVEPHFLYNTLANLRYLIQKNSPDALAMTDALIEYLRTSVPDMRARCVTLGREADHVRHYLDIMRMRLGGRLEFGVDVPEALRAVELPPLVLLTLVENAIKHGIAPLVDGGRVDVRAREAGDAVVIEVADTGAGLGAAQEAPVTEASTGAGLANARGRLWLTYGDAAELTLAANAPRGTVATLRIPREVAAAPAAREPRVLVMSTEEWARMKGSLPPTDERPAA